MTGVQTCALPISLDASARVLEQHTLAVALGEYDSPRGTGFIAQQRERGQRREAQPFDFAACERRVESEVFGREQEVCAARLMARRPATRVAQLRGLGRHVVQPGDQTQCREWRRCLWLAGRSAAVLGVTVDWRRG